MYAFQKKVLCFPACKFYPAIFLRQALKKIKKSVIFISSGRVAERQTLGT
jgi:hypothetical protein